jgi:hypothetical protein
MNYDNYYKNGGMTKEESVSAIALRIGAKKEAVAKFVEKHKIDTNQLNSDLKSGEVYFMDVITAIVGKPDNKYEKEIVKKYGSKMAMGGRTQGYDDREDERLGMKYGKMSGKDFDGSHDMREHSRRDDARFEERMEKGGKLYTTQMNVGRAKYVINYHDGSKTHKDGSPFYDIDIFSNRKDFDKAVKKLESEGYKYRYADGGMMADGGEVYYVKDFYPNYDEDKIASILKSMGAKKVRKAKLYGYSNLPDVVVFEGDKNKAQEVLEKEFPDNYISIYEKDWGRKMADGGMMDDDGDELNGDLYKVGFIKVYEDGEEGDMVYVKEIYGHSEEEALSKFKKIHPEYKIEFISKYADGGMMENEDYDDEPSEEMIKLLQEHEKEAKKNRVKITNLGSNSGDDFIASKTTQRKDGSDFLTSEISDGVITHYWEEFKNGGMMADGGESNIEAIRDRDNYIFTEEEMSQLRDEAARGYNKAFENNNEAKMNYYIGRYELLLEMMPNTGMMAKGGRVYKDWTGRNSKETWGQENLYPNYENTLNLVADVSDYYKELAKDVSEKYAQEQKNTMIEVLKTGKITYNDGATLKFAKGGMLKEDDYVWNEAGKKLVVNKVSDDEYFLSAFGQVGDSPFSKEKVEMYLKNGQWSRKPKMAEGGETKNKWEYTDTDEIEYVVVKDKSGKELKFDGKDVISGVHDLLEKGGKLTEIGKYYSKNDVVSVVVNGKNILDKNTVSGVWIKKDAKPMAEDVADMKIGKTTLKKGFNGWVAKTMVDNFKGFDWDITTIKNSRGDLTTTAQGGKSEDKGGYKMFTFTVFQDPAIRLKSSRPARVTDKVVSAQHEEAMKDFKERQDEIAEMVDQMQAKKKMADGGAIGFDALAKKVAKNYEGDKVKKEFEDEYGKTYDKKEAEEVGKKVAGKVYRQQQAKGKMAKGGKVDKKTGTNLNRSQSKMTLISRKASEIRKANEPWRDAFNRAKAMLYS